jgi:hypothetical protein
MNIEKDIQSYGKNFPVNKAWVPAFAGMTPERGIIPYISDKSPLDKSLLIR